MASYSEVMHRKVLGVPVIYLAGAFVVILALVAWRMKPAAEPDKPPADNGGTDASDPAVGDYSGLATHGTVTVVQQPSTTDAPDATVKTNEIWVREGAEWLTAQHGVSGSQASSALTKYVNGVDRSFSEQEWVDMVIKEKGQPPESIAEGGGVQDKPAQKQFPNPPGTHVIKGSNDNDFRKLATLYYGRGQMDDIDLIQAANPSIGRTIGPFAVGTKIVVPAFHDPVYVNSGRANIAFRDFARKNGLTETQLRVMNDNSKWAQKGYIPANTQVRVK